jgi:hypothetical protein
MIWDCNCEENFVVITCFALRAAGTVVAGSKAKRNMRLTFLGVFAIDLISILSIKHCNDILEMRKQNRNSIEIRDDGMGIRF